MVDDKRWIATSELDHRQRAHFYDSECGPTLYDLLLQIHPLLVGLRLRDQHEAMRPADVLDNRGEGGR